jgi:hypothetical protein
MTPRQNSLSGVIICPAYWMGQRFRVNSITTEYDYKRERNQLSIGTLRQLVDEPRQDELESAALLIPVDRSRKHSN